MTEVKEMQDLEQLFNRISAPRDDISELVELGYASKQKVKREIAGKVDTWLSKQAFAMDMLRYKLNHSMEVDDDG
jgi:hypothetical protein